jgi:3-deoxy-manno-octulosonate cytidylyltransferase (CMP-KDO synthetase)
VKKVAIIPARYAATRFPGKLMKKIGEKTIIRMVYENAVNMDLFDAVWVVTDSDLIVGEIESIGGLVKKSKQEHQTGSDRIAEAVEEMDVDVVVNIQGDEPFVERAPIAGLLSCFENPEVGVASLMMRFGKDEDPDNPNLVKVVCNLAGEALYFSRSRIPFERNQLGGVVYFKHIGVYAYRKGVLLDFTRWPMGSLEKIELLEQLRYLENGTKIKMVETDSNSMGIDTPEDLDRAALFARSR